MDVLSVGMCDPTERPGGLDRYRSELERALTLRGHRVRSVYASKSPSAPGAFRAGGWPQTVTRSAAAAGRLIRDGKPQLIASHFALTGLGALARPRAYRLPWVVHFHGPWADEGAVEEGARSGLRNHLRARTERLVYAHARAVIADSQAFAQIAADRYGLPRQRIAAILPGVDLERFHPGDRMAARQQFGVPADHRVVLTVRRLARRMGLDTLIDAAATLPSDHWQILIAGDGIMRGELEARIRRHRLDGRVRLLGRVPDADLPTLYRTADVFILPTQSLEGFGMVIPEALASGVPVVATPVGGIPEAVEGIPGALLPCVGDSAALASALERLIRGTWPLPSPSEARRFAEARYGWDRVARQVEDIYRGVCAG